ncbi:MAG: Radical domain protein [Geobacteraceae bacterium]|nr:Radical domain protein [Geobacteraceae bacterium]
MNKKVPMRLLLVTIHAFRSPQAVPLAAACLKAFLDGRPAPAQPVTASCADFFSEDPFTEISAAILAGQPDIVAFSLYVWNRIACCSLAEMLRREAPGLTIIAGGPEATADPAGVLGEAPFDFLVVGEGELTLSDALECLAAGGSMEGVAGIARRVDGDVVVSRRPAVTEPGILPSPYLSGVLDAHIPNGVLWQLSRGCSFGCDFCFDGMGDRKVRRYPLERLEGELDYMVQRGVNQIFVLDSTFNQDAKRARALLHLIRKKAPHVHFHFEVRSELLDAEQARLFAGLTCSLQIGLQTSDPNVARNVRRSLDRHDFVARIGLLNRAGAVFGFDLIYGLPGDSLACFREGLDFALALYPNHLDIFPLSVLPGTALAARARDLRLRHLQKPPYTLIDSPAFPAADVAAARRLAAACDIFYSRGKAVAWFNGIVAALRLTPALFLEEFAGWLREKSGGEFVENDFRDEEIHLLQRDFLRVIFGRRKISRLLAAALDLVDYHYYYAAAVLSVAPDLPSEQDLSRIDLLRCPFTVPASTRLAVFNYEILDLLDAGEPNLREIVETLERVGSFAAIYPRGGEVATESLAEPYYRLLERLDGVTPAERIAGDLALPRTEARAFLEFAAEEGIIALRVSNAGVPTPECR